EVVTVVKPYNEHPAYVALRVFHRLLGLFEKTYLYPASLSGLTGGNMRWYGETVYSITNRTGGL
ncbi:MAG: hypothetical protein ACUZ8A_04960, partial [Candidatus Bathyanammoxibius sp.]